jgi:hypothetical protein
VIQLEPLFRLSVDVGPIVTLGMGPYGERRVVPINGGILAGKDLSGEVVPGGADWQIMRADGVLDIDAHYMIRMSGGDLVEIRSQGFRHAPPDIMDRMAKGEAVPKDSYSFLAVIRFQTGGHALQYLNRTIAVASGEREPGRVILSVEAIR